MQINISQIRTNLKENWLIQFSFISFIIFVSLLILAEFHVVELDMSKFKGSDDSLLITFLLYVVIAPFFEELGFRAHLIKNNSWIKIASLTVFSLLVLSLSFEKLTLNILALLYFTILIFNKRNFSPKLCKALYFLNALIFSLVHETDYNGSILKFIINFNYLHISIGFLFLWLALNFGFIYNLICHFAYNLLLFLVLIFSLLFPDTESQLFKETNYEILYEKIPYKLNSKSEILISSDTIFAKNATPKMILKNFPGGKVLDDVYNVKPFTKYNVRIVSHKIKLDSLPNTIDILVKNDLLRVLNEE